ncbi:MAG: minor tail protein [Phage AS32]|nr:MAG: minor tail protein [Phage AS32]
MNYYAGVTPGSGQLVTNARPNITVTAYIDESDIDVEYGYTLTKGGVSYSDSIQFTTVFQGSAGPVSHSFSPPEDLSDGVWTITAYTKAYSYGSGTYIHMSDSPGAATTFTVTSAPTTVLSSPVDNYITAWVGTNHSLPVYWQFQSSSASDYQTAYQVIVRRVDNGTLVYDSGKVAGAGSGRGTGGIRGATAVIPAAQKDVQLDWSVRSWNSSDAATAYPAFRKVLIGTAPVSTITAPTNNQVVTDGTLSITSNATTSGGRTVKAVEASMWLGTTRLWSKTVSGTWTSGASIVITDPSYILPQSTVSYQYRVVHVDSAGLRSTQVIHNFTVVYTPPSAPSVAPTISNEFYSTDGYIRLRWGSESLDSQFYAWVIERNVAPLDPSTNAVGTFEGWEEVGRVYESGISFEFRDYLAPSNHWVAYRIKQVAIRFGLPITSTATSTAVGVQAIADSYWLLAGTSTGTMKKVKNYVLNPIPSGISNWSHNASISTISNVGGKIQLVFNGTAGVAQLVPASNAIPVSLGDKAYFSIKYQGPGNGRMVIVHHRDASNSIVSQSSVLLPTSTGSETTVSLEVTVVSPVVTSLYLAQVCYSGDNPTTNETHLFSEVLFVKSPVPVSFFSGDTPGAVWDGTADASTSSTYIAADDAVESNLVPIRLYNVTGDNFTREIVQGEFNLIGRGRYVEKGDILGVKGTLDCQLRGVTARQKRLILEEFQEGFTKATLRNPFGDVVNVSIGDIQVNRIPGTGRYEFVDVSIPYSEVVA